MSVMFPAAHWFASASLTMWHLWGLPHIPHVPHGAFGDDTLERGGELKMEAGARTIFRVRERLALRCSFAHLLVDLMCLQMFNASISRLCIRVVS
jgi:hypothetical protein